MTHLQNDTHNVDTTSALRAGNVGTAPAQHLHLCRSSASLRVNFTSVIGSSLKTKTTINPLIYWLENISYPHHSQPSPPHPSSIGDLTLFSSVNHGIKCRIDKCAVMDSGNARLRRPIIQFLVNEH